MAIDVEAPTPSHPIAPPVLQTPPPQCLFCCKDLPKDGTEVVLIPCRRCQSPCCASCIRNMFLEACRDATRMPPRCCVPFNIHIAKPYLSAAEITLFRVKHEENCTPNPIYCPVPTCSAFIPDRLLPQHFRNDKKARGDSGIGTPAPELFTCPTCTSGICTGCRQQAHPGSMCTSGEFGLDADTAALLKAWGYKRCPKCGNGVKRMFGCGHMECRCGANFCWICLENINECGGECRDYEDDEDEDGYNSESDLLPNEAADNATCANNTSQEPASVTTEVDTIVEPSTAPATRITNLDGGGSRYWAESSLDFGEEPEDDGSQAVWSCNHYFSPYTVPFETVFAPKTADMECVKCWKTIHPAIEAEKTPEKKKPKSSLRPSTNGVRRRGRPNRGGRGAYMPPRGLRRGNATIGTTIGTAPHLSAIVVPPSQLSLSISRRQSSPMEDVQFSEREMTASGNTATPATPLRDSQRYARSSSTTIPKHEEDTKNDKPTSIFATPSPPSSLAHECSSCFVLVCQSCRDSLIEEQDTKRNADDAETQSEQIAEGPEQRATVVVAEPGDGAVAAAVEGVMEQEEEEEDMPYSLFD